MNNKLISFLLAGVIVGSATVYFWPQPEPSWEDAYQPEESQEHHVHGDFLVYIGQSRLNFSADKYQSTAEQILHQGVHLHDNQGDVVHLHADNVTLSEFFESLGFSLTDDCLTTDEGATFCTDEATVVQLYVNGEPYTDHTNYVLNDEDKLLLYVGAPNQPALQQYLTEISDRACIYSGTCPERGTPPPEECGLTCEL